MAGRLPDSLDRLSHDDLIGVVRDLIDEVTRLRSENEKLSVALGKLRAEHQAVKDELARLKHLPPRPPIKRSGMDKATDAKGPESGGGEKGGRSTQRRGSQLDKLTIGATVVVTAKAPAGSRHKGYEDIVVQDLSLKPTVTRYRRERWETPDGETIVANLDPGIVGGYGPNLNRLVLALHFAGQMTCERIVALLNGMGVVISKRQVVRLLTVRLETFRAEDAAVLRAGLSGAYVTVDDTGARHAGKSGYTTQIGSFNFTAFRTGPSKSRLAFLSRLCGGTSLWVINDAALDYMKRRDLPQTVIDKFARHEARIFVSADEWERHLQALALGKMKVLPDPVLIASEAALWGAIHHQGLLQGTVIVSDDAGQFRVGVHALCWVHAERLVHKLIPASDRQRNAVEVARRMIWWFYRGLKDYKLAPGPEQAELLRSRFDRIFKRARTGYATLDSLLKRLHRHKDALLRVLERPEIPLNTNASENDIRAFVTKRKISGGTVSDKGRDARDVMLGLAKTCMKLKVSFYEFIGDRLGIPGPKIPDLATLVSPAPT
ncbi:MAG TPA: transposase [Terriglobia bacterium]|nr:transposase [Terriglobia bacterium]